MSRAPREDEVAFEELLLGAGLAEASPEERTEAAWLRFTAGVAALQGSVAGAAPLAGPATGKLDDAWARRIAGAKWLGLGVIAGGVATFAWLQQTTAAAVRPPVTSVAQTAAAAARAPAVDVVEPKSSPAPVEVPRAELASSARAVARPAPKSAPSLAAEVAALDEIRTAISIGALGDAEQRLTDYRRNFTQGALRSDAEVLALEVLVAQGRRQAAARAAERFISQHPRDPQVARVRALVE